MILRKKEMPVLKTTAIDRLPFSRFFGLLRSLVVS
jgi:hypothetical protein